MTNPREFPSSTGAATASAIHDPLAAALNLRAQGRLHEALDILSAQGEFPVDFYTLRGDLQVELDQIKEAAGSYFTATVAEPGNIYAQCNLGLCLRRLERWDQAAETFQQVLSIDPHRDEIRLDLGDCLLRLNRYEEALACFDACWSDAARRQALFGKAVSLQFLRRFDEAEMVYERVLTLDGKAAEAFSNLIAMSMEVFDLERVERYSRRLGELDPQSPMALQGLTLVAIERGDLGYAARSFAELAELAPDTIGMNGADWREDDDGTIEYRLSRDVLR